MWTDPAPNLVCFSLPFLPVAQAKNLRVTLDSLVPLQSSSSPSLSPTSLTFKMNPESYHSFLLPWSSHQHLMTSDLDPGFDPRPLQPVLDTAPSTQMNPVNTWQVRSVPLLKIRFQCLTQDRIKSSFLTLIVELLLSPQQSFLSFFSFGWATQQVGS